MLRDTFTITIVDNTPPTITCPATSTVAICSITEVPPFPNGTVGASQFEQAGGILDDNWSLRLIYFQIR